MNTHEKIKSLILKVRKYDLQNPDLHQSHHFLFGKFTQRELSSPNVLLMGFNPGETKQDWLKTKGSRSEESLLIDFHSDHPTPSAKRWYSAIDFFLPNSNIIMTELFFWSTSNIAELERKYGTLDSRNKHLDFCTGINHQLIEALNTKLIIFSGLTHLKRVAKIFGLTVLNIESVDGSKVAALAIDEKNRKWIFTKHWTGSFGFTMRQRNAVKDIIATHS